MKDSFFGGSVVGVHVGFANNCVNYFFTDDEAKYSTKDLAEGSYTVRIKYYGNETYIASNKVTAKIIVLKNATMLTSNDINVLVPYENFTRENFRRN